MVAEPEYDLIGLRPSDLSEDDLKRAATILGGLVLGQAAEAAFEDIYRSEMGQEVDFKLVDLREGRSDTDYRVLNGRGRGIFRLNIKFFGSTFRRGAELVGLEPEDCFPLATYKILSAVEKQTAEHLPFVFTVVGVPNLTAISMRNYFSEDDITMIALITKSKKVSGKRNLEEKVVARLVDQKSKAFTEAYNRIRSSDWYIISARKADDLFRKMFIERVYALRVRNFAKVFGGAEVYGQRPRYGLRKVGSTQSWRSCHRSRWIHELSLRTNCNTGNPPCGSGDLPIPRICARRWGH
jgi:hypothetical protein